MEETWPISDRPQVHDKAFYEALIHPEPRPTLDVLQIASGVFLSATGAQHVPDPILACELDEVGSVMVALFEALKLILPMARGYARCHLVGRNAEHIEFAEAALSAVRE